MADVFSKDKRSEIMSRIRSKNTRAEIVVFRYLRRNKVYFQRHYSRALGKPDIALPRKKKAVFIDGDFWHGKTYEDVKRKYEPGSYWVVKIAGNMERDKRQRRALEIEGWQILTVWEKDVLRKRTQPAVLEEIRNFLTSA